MTLLDEIDKGNKQSRSVQTSDADLLSLIKSAFSTWRAVLVAIVIVSVILFAYKAFTIAFLPGDVTYSKPIRLTFKGADKLEFPSGAKFSYGDIIAPAVASTVFANNHLEKYGLTAEELQRSLSAEPYAPTYPLIIEKYQKKLADKRLSVDQISELEQSMWSDIKQATFGTVLISLHLEKDKLSEELASKVLADIPAIWAERAIRDRGVLDIDIPISTSKTLNSELIEHVEYMIVSDLLDEKLSLLRKNVKALSASQGVSTVKDPITGMSLFDLSTAIDDLDKYIIDEVLSPIRYLGLSKDSKLSIFYYEDKLRKKSEMNLSLLENQAELSRQAYDSYVQNQKQIAIDGGQKSTASTISPQINNDLLDRLVAMSGDNDREKYRQKLNQQWLKYTLDAAEVKAKITDIKAILISLKRVESSSSVVKTDVNLEYLDRVKNTLPDILTKLSGYFDITDRIYRQLSIESVGIRDQLYIPITNSVLINKAGFEIKQTFIIWLALIFLTVVIVLPVCMIQNAMKDHKLTAAN